MAAAAHLLVMTVAPELALHLVRGRQHQVAGAVVPAPHHLIAERDVQILAAADAALLVQVAVALLAPVLVPATADRIVPANAALTVPVPALLLAALPAPAAVKQIAQAIAQLRVKKIAQAGVQVHVKAYVVQGAATIVQVKRPLPDALHAVTIVPVAVIPAVALTVQAAVHLLAAPLVPVPALLLAALPAPAAVAAAVLLIVPIHVPAPPKQLVTHVLPHANKHVHRHAAQPAPAIVHLPVTVIVSQHVKDVAPALHIVLRDQVVQITDAIFSAQTPVMQNVMVHVM